MKSAIQRLEAIAKKNHDRFSYNIGIWPKRTGEITYEFVCRENADQNIFVQGRGSDIDLAVREAVMQIDEACQLWGYKNAKPV